MCPGEIAPMPSPNACVFPILRLIKTALYVFFQQKQCLPVFTVFPVIFRLGSNFQYAILLIFVWWFVFNPPRAPIHTPSCVYMHLKWSGTEITSKNPKISTLHPNNFFLAGFCYTILYETYLIPIYSFYWKFAPILRSQKKVDFLWTGSTYFLFSLTSQLRNLQLM